MNRRDFLKRSGKGIGALVSSSLFGGCAEFNQFLEQSSTPDFFVCNYWLDKNQDGFMAKKEFVGVKDNFRANEKITLVSYFYDKKGAKVTTKLWNGEGKIIYEREVILPFVDNVNQSGGFDSWELYNKGGVGDYTASWYLNDSLVATKSFKLRK